jgi:uncharacterized protein with beta-barrel porin domain
MKAVASVCPAILLSLFTFSAIATPPTGDQRCSRDEPANCLNGVGPAVINSDNIRTTSTFFSGQISNQAAGHSFAGWGIWASYNNSGFDADLPINSPVQPIASYDAKQHNVMIGADKLFMGRFVAGLALGYEDTDIATAYNGGNNIIEGFSAVPYFAYLVNDVFSIDAAAGYTTLDYDTDRIDNVSGATIFGKFDSDRWFVTAGINAIVTHNQWVLGARAGYLYTEENQDGYTETGPNTARTIRARHIDLSQGILALNIGYSFGWLEPYAHFAYHNDLGRDEGISAGAACQQVPAQPSRTMTTSFKPHSASVISAMS